MSKMSLIPATSPKSAPPWSRASAACLAALALLVVQISPGVNRGFQRRDERQRAAVHSLGCKPVSRLHRAHDSWPRPQGLKSTRSVLPGPLSAGLRTRGLNAAVRASKYPLVTPRKVGPLTRLTGTVVSLQDVGADLSDGNGLDTLRP